MGWRPGADETVECSGATFTARQRLRWYIVKVGATTRIGSAYNLHMGTPFDRWVTLRDDVEQVRLDFIRTDLQVCLTFASVAETEYDSMRPMLDLIS
jgi:hypothetical protein